MCRFLASLIAVVLTPLATGCVTCDSPFDSHYTATGGSIHRADRASGRVNSAFVRTTLDEPADDNTPSEVTKPAIYVDPAPPSSFPLFEEDEALYDVFPAPR